MIKEALVHFLGGQDNLIRRVDILNGSTVIGQLKAIMLDDFVRNRIL